MSDPRAIQGPQFEDIETACEIMNFLRNQGKTGEATHISYILSEWALTAGFGQGLLEMQKVISGKDE